MAAFEANVRGVHGAAGEAWLARLPEVAAGCARRWGLTLEPPFALTYAWVAPARRADGTEVVLKLGLPGDPELHAEAEVLALLGGHGAVELLAVDHGEGALLLERVRPGATLEPLPSAGRDEEATRALAGVMHRLWRPAPRGLSLPTVDDWGRGFARHRAAHRGGSGPLPAGPFARAERAFATLCASQASSALLHGDLHHGNVLSATRAPWLAIDPKGLIGEPAYEAGALLRNPPGLTGLPEPGRLTRLRLDVLAAELRIDREHLRAWAFAQAVLAAIWSVEDHGEGFEEAMACAALLERA